jgi:hypothetical protein
MKERTPFVLTVPTINGSSLTVTPWKNSPAVVISNYDIVVEEIRRYIDDGHEVETKIRGKFKSHGCEKPFELSSAGWCDNSEFTRCFTAIAPDHFHPIRSNIDYIRQASMAFSRRRTGIEHKNFLLTQGYYDSASSYLMPSVVVDKEGVKPNTEQHVELSNKEYARHMDFAILEDHDIRDVLLHLRTDFLNTWPRNWTTVALAHALSPAVIRPLNLRQKPTLFFEGQTGSGKTELTVMCQQFWGNFPSILNMQSSAKGLMDVGYDFKDSLLVVDDYKGMTHAQTVAVENAIQYGYGDSVTVKMGRNQTQSKTKGSRALLMMSGEHFLSADAAMVARTILIETTTQDTGATRELYQNCVTMSKKYCGITPKFIHWFLSNDRSNVESSFQNLRKMIYEKISGRLNAERLAYNLGLNHLTWRLFVQFMLQQEVVSHSEAQELLLEHWKYIEDLCWAMIGRCEDEQNSWVFIRVLKQIIESGEVSIKGLKGYDHAHKKVIAFSGRGSTPGTAYFYPDITWQSVKNSAKDMNIRGTVHSIGRLLKDSGIIVDSEKNRVGRQIRVDGAEKRRMWVVDLEKLGLGDAEKIQLDGAPEPLNFEPSGDTQNMEGIL